MVTNLQAEFDKALSEVDATNILKSSMKEIVSNMVNDEELCVLFYNRDEEYKKIMESIREEILEDARNGTLQPELLEFFRKRSEEEKIERAKEIAEEIAEERAKEIAEEIAKEKIEETIVSMHEKGLSLEMIADILKLSMEEVQQIIDNQC